MLLHTARLFSEDLEFLASSLNTNISIEDLMILSEIDPDIIVDIETVQNFFSQHSEPTLEIAVHEEELNLEENPWLAYRNCTWKRLFEANWMISEFGDIWDIAENAIKPQYFIEGDMRVLMHPLNLASARRVAPLVTKCFGISSNSKTGRYIIEFLDGDRRNLAITNMRWIPEPADKPTDMQLLVDDICRRLVDSNGDIDKILPLYEKSKPAVTKSMLADIRTKKIHREVSDKYFMFQAGSFFPRTKGHMDFKTTGVDTGGLYITTRQLDMVIPLIVDKIKNGVPLSKDDATILILNTSMSNKKKAASEVAKLVKETYHVEYPADIVADILNDKSNTIARAMRGEI